MGRIERRRNFEVLFLVGLFFTFSLVSSLPVYLSPLEDGVLQPNTDFDYVFNFTTSSDCSGVLLSLDEAVTTDSYGLGFVDLDISSLGEMPSYLCEYRDGSLRAVHNFSDVVFGDVWGEDVNLSGTVYAGAFVGDGSGLTGVGGGTSWTEITNGTVFLSESYNASGLIVNWSEADVDFGNLVNVPSGLGDGDDDTTYTNGTGLSLVGNVFSLVGSFFSGSWDDLVGVPEGFADGVDNDSQLTENEVDAYVSDNGYLTSESDSLAYNGSLALNSSLANYYLVSNPYGFYNSTTVPDYLLSEEGWDGNYSDFLAISSWNDSGLIRDWNDSGLIVDWNGSGLVVDWNASGYVKDWGGDIVSANSSLYNWVVSQGYLSSVSEGDPLWDGNSSLVVYDADTSGWDKDSSDDFDGSWGSLTGVPEGFADGVDNQSTGGADWSEITSMPSGFSDGVDNDSVLSEAEVDAYVGNNGYYNSSDFDYTTFYFNSNPYGFYNSTTVPDYLLSEEGWDGNYSDFLAISSWNDSGLIRDWNDSGLIVDWNGSGLVVDWNASGYIKDWSGDIVSANSSLYDWVVAQGYLSSVSEGDPLWDGNSSLVVYDADTSGWDKDSSDDFDGAFSSLSDVPSGLADGDNDTTYTNGTGLSLVGNVFSLVGSFFSGSWDDLVGVPEGFADGVDNDSQLTESEVDAYVDNNGYLTGEADPLWEGNLTGGLSSNLILNGNYLSGDGGDEGVYVDGDGSVGVGTDNPNGELEVAGNVNVSSGNVTISSSNKMCFTQDCSSYVWHNGTNLQIVG